MRYNIKLNASQTVGRESGPQLDIITSNNFNLILSYRANKLNFVINGKFNVLLIFYVFLKINVLS